ncbi:MAG: PAS domain-containing protein [Bacteroidota bacterium]
MAKQAARPAGAYFFLDGGGETGQLIHEHNWDATSLGPIEQWPLSLRSTLGIMLHSAFPMFLFWGREELLCFYNDAYRPSLGIDGKHPAIGKNAKEVWPDIWEFIGPLIEQVMTRGTPVWYEDQLLPIYRNGKMEDVYWTFSYSPAYDDNGNIGGVFVTCTETTDKVKNISRLRESERSFRNLVREATVGIVIMRGRNYVVEMVNESYGMLIDRTPEELMHKPIFDVIPETGPYFRAMLDGVMNTGESVNLNEHPYFVYADGRKIEGFLNFVYQPYKEEDGTITGVIAICQDVTEQVRSRRKAENSEQQLRAIVESAPFPIGVYAGREMRIVLANRSILDVWGKGYDVIGKLYSDILPELSNQAIFQQLDDVYTTGVAFHARDQRVDLVVDGRLQPYYFNYSFTPVYDADGNVYGVMNTAAEVTDLNMARQKVEQSEKNFRNIILQAPVAMCMLLGPQHVVAIANEMMIALWGKEEEDVLYKPLFDAVPDTREQGLERMLAEVYETGVQAKAAERPIAFVRNDKTEITYIDIVYEPYQDELGTTLGVLVTCVDVTQQVLARQQIEDVVAARTKELAMANDSLQRSNAALEQFAYIASHDLQEPLRKVSTYSQMLEQNLGSIDDRSKHYLDKINSSTARMATLVRGVLTYSQLSGTDPGFSKVSLENVVGEILTDFELLIAQRNASVMYSGLPEIMAIPLQMSQLFGNLIGNALKFCKANGTPEVSISAVLLPAEEVIARGLADGGRYYSITVADNGIGFDQQHAQRIFNIFQRLHGKTDYLGTGIGLAMCRKIAENHGGDIYAESTPGEGARFTVILPEDGSEQR